MLSLVLLLLLGLALLVVGGEGLVRGATTIARIAGVTPAVIGLTVVAMGTSLPELTVSVMAGLRGQSDLAVANVVGSNIFNVSAALGVTALLMPLPVHGNAVRLEWPVMFLATCTTLLVLRDGLMDRVEGSVFLAALVFFTVYAVRIARREVSGRERAEFNEAIEARSIHTKQNSSSRELAISITLILVGLICLVGGGRWLLDGATGLARLAGLSERVIGLTIVAAGTGMPELATSLVAVRRNQTDVAVANMIGSNIFNLLGTLGVAALVRPIAFSPAAIASDVTWMLGTTLLLYPVMLRGMRVTRVEGALMVLVYAAYIGLLLR